MGSDRTAITSSPSKVGSDFADHLNGLLNALVTDSRLALVSVGHDSTEFEIVCMRDGDKSSFELDGTELRLFVSQRVRVVCEKGDDHVQTLSYSYRLQRDSAADSWLLRWEYLRKPPSETYRYPLGHLHVNGGLDTGLRALPKLHLATGRVPIELVLWHLISDWGVEPRKEDWRDILRESVHGFEDRRTAPPA